MSVKGPTLHRSALLMGLSGESFWREGEKDGGAAKTRGEEGGRRAAMTRVAACAGWGLARRATLSVFQGRQMSFISVQTQRQKRSQNAPSFAAAHARLTMGSTPIKPHPHPLPL